MLPSHSIQENRELASHLANISRALQEIEPVLLMTAMGIEYRQFARFAKVILRIEGMLDGSVTIDQPSAELTDLDVSFAIDFITQTAVRVHEIDPDPPHRSGLLNFGAEQHFEVTLPSRGNLPERMINGTLTEIGGGWEAWIHQGAHLARIKRCESRDAAVSYLDQYRHNLIGDGGRAAPKPV